MFANQPVVEGDGFTDEQLISFGSEAGLTGAELDTFTQCVTDGTYLGFATNTGATFHENGHPGTPYALLNGIEMPTEILVDPEALETLVDETAAAGSGEARGSVAVGVLTGAARR